MKVRDLIRELDALKEELKDLDVRSEPYRRAARKKHIRLLMEA